MGQYSGFITRYDITKHKALNEAFHSHGITEITLYRQLSLVLGIVKGDSDGHGLSKLRLCGLEEIRVLGQLDSSGDGYPDENGNTWW